MAGAPLTGCVKISLRRKLVRVALSVLAVVIAVFSGWGRPVAGDGVGSGGTATVASGPTGTAAPVGEGAPPSTPVGEDGGVLVPAQLVVSPARYDGRMVTLRGEVIGSIMLRGEHGWVNVGDPVAAVGVWAPAAALPAIRFSGGYARRGDTVLVTGVFHQACPQHGGDPDVHASSVQVVESGAPLEHPVPVSKWAVGATLLGAGALLAAVARRPTRR